MQPNANTGAEQGIAVTAGVTASFHSCWCCFSIAIHGLFQPRELRPLTVSALTADCQGSCFSIVAVPLCLSIYWTEWQLCVSASSSSNHVASSCFGICILGLCSSSVFQHVRPRVCVAAFVFQHRSWILFCKYGHLCTSNQWLGQKVM